MAAITNVKELVEAIYNRLEDNKSDISTGRQECSVFIGDTGECIGPNEAGYPFLVIGDPREDYHIKSGDFGTNTIDVPIALYNQYVDVGAVAQGRFNQNGLPEMASNILGLLRAYIFPDSGVYFAMPVSVEPAEGWEMPDGEDEMFPSTTTFYRKKLTMRYRIDF